MSLRIFTPSPPSSPSSPRLPLPASLTSPTQQTSQRNPAPPLASPLSLRVQPSNRVPGDLQSPTPHSATHAGGIQPSMSFFRPARPTQQPTYSRPSTVGSITDVVDTSLEPESFQLNDVDHRVSDSFEDQDANHLTTAVRGGQSKPSREPLLPIFDRQGQNERPSMMRDRSSSLARTHRVRTSFDRVMGLSRGLSFESLRKTPGIVEGRVAYESKGREEQDNYDLPPLPTHYKRASSPGGYVDNLGVDHRHSGMRTTFSHSPDTSFVPTPPDHRPPLSAVPVINPVTKKPYRVHELHPSGNKFFLAGRLLTGGDSPWAFVASFLLVLTIAGVFFGTTCVWWWQNQSPAVAAVGIYMALLVISTMLATATTDPGILPREIDPDPPYSTETPSDGLRVPMPRDLKVRNDVVRTKYCPTCRTYRPPRSSHCKMCDNCVDGCDHHCQWVNNCVGRRNYTTFFVLLLSTTFTLILIICTSALHLFFLTHRDNLDFRHALRRGAGSAVVFCLSIIVIWPVAALLSYHMRLLLLNITTIEQIRNQAHKTLIPDAAPPNPFSHGNWRRNLVNVLCRPPGYSWLSATAIVTEDKREVNPS